MAEVDVRLNEAIIDGKISFNPEQIEKWKNAGYGIVGHHSAVEICSWTKKSLLNKGTCYKNKFYGVDTHRCAQMSPAAAWCQEACIFCWRPMEWYSRVKMSPNEVDPPEEIIDGVVKERKRLLSGFGGNEHVDKQLFHEAYDLFPSHWAISLSGEPTIYPLLPEMILELRKHKEVRSIFIVTNGQEPDMIKRMSDMDALPTQLYISVTAPNKELFKEINRSIYEDGWERLNRTLEMMPTLRCRRVIRFTMIKGINDNEEFAEVYAKLFEKSKTDYIEVKAYMHLGQSRKRLSRENMPTHDEVKDYALKILSHLKNYEFHDEHPPSRIVLLKRKDSPYNDYISGPRAEDSLKNKG